MIQPESPDTAKFRFQVGTSLLAEFAVGHTPADVLRELVQNEYDAGGTELVIEFGEDALMVRGNGKTIDRPGWKRLSVILGTGSVAGGGERIQAKTNGIGSKNFGLRSLFLFGDRIHVTSGGQMTMLDWSQGTLESPVPDAASLNSPGVDIRVPYRRVADGLLQGFDEAKELEALRSFAVQLAPTLLKLAEPGKRKSLRTVVVRSERLGHEMRWHQSARHLPGSTSTLKRTIRVTASPDLLGDRPESISELEHQCVLRPPAELPKRNIPEYFRVSGGRLRLGVSVRLRGRRLDLEPAGTLYYPLGASGALTGFPFSVSAPFEMNEDRSSAIDPLNSEWNAWLLEQAARFTVGPVSGELFASHGADAFAVIDPRHVTTAIPLLCDEIRQRLSTEQCWPSMATRRDGRPKLTSTTGLVVTGQDVSESLAAQVVEAQNELSVRLSDRPAIASLAVESGAKMFTLNSLIHLRCGGSNATVPIETPIDDGDEANYQYPEFPAAFDSLEVQTMFAAAIDEAWPRLQTAHKRDLRQTPTTMNAAGTLAPAADLWVVDGQIATAIPRDRALHPELARYEFFSGLCRRFDASKWAIDTSVRIFDGVASSEERDALAAYLQGKPQLSQKAWAAVRKAPILIDQRGETVSAADMVSSSAKGVRFLSAALHLPRRKDETNESLKPLRFRTKLIGADLIALAELVEEGGALPAAMCTALTRLPDLVTPSVVSKLKGIRFLATESGTLVAPEFSYVRSDRLVAIFGESASYAVGLSATVLRKLGSRSEAEAADIVASLEGWRERRQPPTRPDVVYRALVDALRRERMTPSTFRDRAILWTGHDWRAPVDCLVGSEHKPTFARAVTVLPGGSRDVWLALGVPTKPNVRHWRRLFVWASERFGDDSRTPQRVADGLRRAYGQLDGLPDGLQSDTRCLVDDDGRLHAVTAAKAQRLLVNDDPLLAGAAAEAQVPVAVVTPRSRAAASFLAAVGVRPLSEVAVSLGVDYGAEVPPDEFRGADTTLQRLRAQQFASAVAALLLGVEGALPTVTENLLTERLSRIDRITIVDGIYRQYQLAGRRIRVRANYHVTQQEIAIDRVSDTFELRRAVAVAVAEIADDSPLSQQLVGDAIFFLLRCRSVSEMRRELARRKIPWQPPDEFDAVAIDAAEIEDDQSDAPEGDSSSLAGSIARAVVRNALARPPRTPNAGPTPSEVPNRPRPPLPDIGDVRPREAEPVGVPSDRVARNSTGGGPGTFTPRTDKERAADEELGRRGEEVILEIERKRVAALGMDSSRVVWTAACDPYADHDIKSVADDGEDLWIEVKSTTGRHGRFSWPRAEFALAVREGDHYWIYRVYEADTVSPQWKCFPDPIGQFRAGALHLELDSYDADLGPLA